MSDLDSRATAAPTAHDNGTAFIADLTNRLAGEGFPRAPAAVLMALVAAEAGAAEASELATRLGLSRGAISGAVRYLTLLGVIRIEGVPGTRRHRYALAELPWYTVSLARTERYSTLADAIDAHLIEFPPGSAAAKRVAETRQFFRFLVDRMPALLEEWQALRTADGERPVGSE